MFLPGTKVLGKLSPELFTVGTGMLSRVRLLMASSFNSDTSITL